MISIMIGKAGCPTVQVYVIFEGLAICRSRKETESRCAVNCAGSSRLTETHSRRLYLSLPLPSLVVFLVFCHIQQ